MITCSTNLAVPGLLPFAVGIERVLLALRVATARPARFTRYRGKMRGGAGQSPGTGEQGLIVTVDLINQGGDGQVVVKRRAGAED